jgi:hypothetical protein
MAADELAVLDDVSPGAWIGPRLGGEFGAVTLTVPSGYAAYARICHPASDADGSAISWARVAEATGRRAHALMQWHALVGSPDSLNMTGSLWRGGNPARGNLAAAVLVALCELLPQHTQEAAHCFFGVWEGYGDDELQRLVATHPRLKPSGDRAYLLISGPLSAAPEVCHLWIEERFRFAAQSPNLIWPADRAWFVASEIDFDSTLVGGPSSLIEEILASAALEAWPVEPDSTLAYDADRVNVVPNAR